MNEIRKVLLLVVVLTCLGLLGCGGGTSGTSQVPTGGGTFRLISGSVVDVDGMPVTGAVVKVAGGDNSTTTDSTGKFEFSEQTESNITLTISEAGKEFALPIVDIDPAAKTISVDTVLDRSTLTVQSRSVEGSVKFFTCQEYAKINGSNISLTLPKQVNGCSLTYQFRSSNLIEKYAKLKVTRSNCGGTDFVQTGTQLTGRRLDIYQSIYIQDLKGTCSAEVEAEILGFVSKTTFKFMIKRRSR